MALKFSIFLITIELLLFVYIVLDIYASAFIGLNNVVSPEDRLHASNEDPKIVGIGNFAVDEYNKLTNSNLKFESVVKALYAESRYMVVIEVSDGVFSESKHYGAIVMEQGNRMSLVAFQEYMQPAI